MTLPSPAELHAQNELDAKNEIDLSLSGGGIRATLYHLGVLIHLANTQRLSQVKSIVSVSGGSITSGHFAKHWKQATANHDGFLNVAGSLVKFTRSDLRHAVLMPWIWSRLTLLWMRQKWGRSARLKAAYHEHYGPTTMGDLNQNDIPKIAIVATDTFKQERIAFTPEFVLRFPLRFNGTNDPNRIGRINATGTHLSLAVAASSCFPFVFPKLVLKADDLGLIYDDFKETLKLKDGGIAGNIGVEILLEMRRLQGNPSRIVVISSAERPQTVEPSDTPLNDANVVMAALSAGAMDRAREILKQNCIFMQFSERTKSPNGLPVRVESKLFGYRTDLDAPSWQEIHALLIHGVVSAENAFKETAPTVHHANLETIKAVLASAGCNKVLNSPTEEDLKSCGRLPWARVITACCIVVVIFLMVASLLYKAWTWRPSYALNDLDAHIAMIKNTASSSDKDSYKHKMEGETITWKAVVEYSDGKKARLATNFKGEKYLVFITFLTPTSLPLNKEVTIQGRLTDVTDSGSYITDAIVLPN